MFVAPPDKADKKQTARRREPLSSISSSPAGTPPPVERGMRSGYSTPRNRFPQYSTERTPPSSPEFSPPPSGRPTPRPPRRSTPRPSRRSTSRPSRQSTPRPSPRPSIAGIVHARQVAGRMKGARRVRGRGGRGRRGRGYTGRVRMLTLHLITPNLY